MSEIVTRACLLVLGLVPLRRAAAQIPYLCFVSAAFSFFASDDVCVSKNVKLKSDAKVLLSVTVA